MANTLPDVTLLTNVWNDLYHLTSILQGTPLILKNKSSVTALIVISPTAPALAFSGGWDLVNGDWVHVTVPEGSKVWAKGQGKLFVQVDE